MSDTQPPLGAADVRDATGLTPHQLGELTARLALDVGPRRNYPAYSPAALTLLLAVTALRECGMTLDAAAPAVRTYAEVLVAGRGWLILSPTDDDAQPSPTPRTEWTCVHAMDGETITKLIRATGGRAVVLEVESIQRAVSRLRVGPQVNT